MAEVAHSAMFFSEILDLLSNKTIQNTNERKTNHRHVAHYSA